MWSRPYVLEIETSKARPTAASQAAKTNRTTGIMLIRRECVFKAIRVLMMNNDNIIPSRHSREDMRCER